jgi:polysaccharide pyruvyl transferase WcaK-like protein
MVMSHRRALGVQMETNGIAAKSCGHWKVRSSAVIAGSVMKVLYLGWLGAGNIGDEACYLAFQRLMGPSFECTADISNLEGVDAIVLGGGTILRACSDSLTTDLLDARAPFFIVGSGIELYGYPAHRVVDNFYATVRKARMIGVRGPLTRDFLGAHALEGEIIGDLAMCLEAPGEQRESRTIGFNIGSVRGYLFGDEERLLKRSNQLVASLTRQGYVVKAFGLWPEDDLFLDRLQCAERVPYMSSVMDVMGFMKSCRVVIGEKLHASVLSFASNVPFVSLAYRHKCLDFMNSLDATTGKHWVKTDDPRLVDRVLAAVRDIERDHAHLKRCMAATSEQYKDRQRGFFDRLRTRLVDRTV